ncbi:tyrosine-type recombinase/integrase [Arthrobacter bambusae]|uniref:tyrosine-type recombinase/integrase n=1 Tax=Arthrobacter bambusae TaxID=1338426 RepID=UPI002785C876|nr:tyrosine-type recombinase/integrase [Arthrobacter bambusae]MDQ0213128.1 site-specific recombinase XerD [Arthrobacter bambusae]MDQ0237422.1 site-specific recombinase XerD [Arthrobacter bambusae]
MEKVLSTFAEGVMAETASIGLANESVRYYRSCCHAVVRFCDGRGTDLLTEQAVEEFLAAMDERGRRGEFGPTMRSTLEKTARMMLQFQQAGVVDLRRRRPAPGPSMTGESFLTAFAESLRGELASSSVRLVVCEARQFLLYLDSAGCTLGAATLDDVRGFLVAVAPRHTSGMGNTVWAIKRFFGFVNQQGSSELNVQAMLARVGPRRARALPCFTTEETGRILAAIETGSPRGKRDYAMVRLALSTGLRCCDIVSLRLNQIDWRRDEIHLVQHKTSAPLALPLSAEAGNAIAGWLLHGRPVCETPEVFVRVYAPFVKLSGPTGALIMNRWLHKAGVSHQAHDGKTFHALRRTTGTRLVESGAELELASQVLGHGRLASYHRCRAMAGDLAPGSTPYTLRHNYATRTLTRWVEEGRDLNVWLPYLSAYMGHETYSATAYYIHLLPERLSATGLSGTAGIIPEVTP